MESHRAHTWTIDVLVYINELTNYFNEGKASLCLDKNAIYLSSMNYIDVVMGLEIKL